MSNYGDLHIHSIYSSKRGRGKKLKSIDSLNTIEDIFLTAREKNLSVVAIADHDNQDSLLEVKEMSKKTGIVAIPAIEVSSAGGHILALFVEGDIRPYHTVEETVAEIHAKGGLAIAAHPFFIQRFSLGPLNKKKALRMSDVQRFDFDGLEALDIFTGKEVSSGDISKMSIAKVGGSDAHYLNQIGLVKTVFPDSCKTLESYKNAILNKKTKVIGERIGLKRAIMGSLKCHLFDRFRSS